MSDLTRFPLSWPPGRARTARYARNRPRFKAPSFARSRDDLLAEIKRLGGRDIILSTNVELRQDGLPYANRRNPDDPGVAVYFTRKGKAVAFACDRWISVEENMRAIADAIECIRTIERRGTGEMVDAAFTGFQALPPGGSTTPPKRWWDVLVCQPHSTEELVRSNYRYLATKHHPDRGGDHQAMVEINAAFEEFKKERGL